MPSSGIEPETRGFSVLCSTNWANWAQMLSHWVAGIGFEPMTFGLWARRASRLLHPAILVSAFIQLSKMWRKIQTVLFSQNYFLIFTPNGRRRIRTFEGIASRFTVCPLWPLGNLPIYTQYEIMWKADDRTRTDNLLITNQLLCQLSHIGIYNKKWDL